MNASLQPLSKLPFRMAQSPTGLTCVQLRVPSGQEGSYLGEVNTASANREAAPSPVGRRWCDSLLIHRLQTPELTAYREFYLFTCLLQSTKKAIILAKPTLTVLVHFFPFHRY